MNNFDIREFLTENKLTENSKLNEEMASFKALEGGKVDFTTILRDDTVQIYFDNGSILEFKNDGFVSILKR